MELKNTHLISSDNREELAGEVLSYIWNNPDDGSEPNTPHAAGHIFGIDLTGRDGFSAATYLMKEYPRRFDRTCESVDHLIESGQVTFDGETGALMVIK